ncbi:unnamed protein product [Arctia plantaginis]|uniref:Cupin-like domain-containing protein n=1 Tax=Arctia plantaginis TaxID=874455 RepID=A0A8S0YSZ4_ARCPL|nr:unnamed protein product [Arctia plantaginis]
MNQSLRPKTCSKNYKTAELKLQKIINKIDSLKLNNSYVSRLEVSKSDKTGFGLLKGKSLVYLLSSVVVTLVSLLSAQWISHELIGQTNCVLQLPSFSKSAFRPPEDCSMCARVSEVVRLANTTAEEFEKEFNFNFFANFYNRDKMGKQINDCFYFAYKSGLNSLQEVFDMDEARANLSGEPWYVGWSTCYDEETRLLRSYYNRPYFLPKTAESDMVDWIFMGGPGQGAHMHVDSVKHMSWQAQVRGRKEWQLAPPPECLYKCTWITFTVSPGEILVVDTNRWYHKTNVLPGDISITIGAEYD